MEGVSSLSDEERTVVIKQIDPFKVQELKDYLVELNVKFPDIVYAQARLESNGFKSRIFLENNNMFGMKQSTRRSSTNKGEQYGHAYYDTWRESVLDYALWQCKYLSQITTRAEYLEYLKNNYAQDPNYYNKLIKIINN
jgi:flagellum-specific peptidoglycan hydrolase FlgJ